MKTKKLRGLALTLIATLFIMDFMTPIKAFADDSGATTTTINTIQAVTDTVKSTVTTGAAVTVGDEKSTVGDTEQIMLNQSIEAEQMEADTEMVISTDTELNSDNYTGQYVDKIIINPGCRLTIADSIQLNCREMQVNGKLYAFGTSERHVEFNCNIEVPEQGEVWIQYGDMNGSLNMCGTVRMDSCNINNNNSTVVFAGSYIKLFGSKIENYDNIDITGVTYIYDIGDSRLRHIIDTSWLDTGKTTESKITLRKGAYKLLGCTIPEGVELVLEPGVRVEADSNMSFIKVNGKLTSLGTPDEHVILTGVDINPDMWTWGGLICEGNTGVLELENTDVFHANSISNKKGTTHITNCNTTVDLQVGGSDLMLKNSTFKDEAKIELSDVKSINEISGNKSTTGREEIYKLSGTLTSNIKLDKGHYVTQGFTIAPTGTLDMQPGVQVKVLPMFMNDALDAMTIRVEGKLITKGTQADPIIFTNSKDKAYFEYDDRTATTGKFFGFQVLGEMDAQYIVVNNGICAFDVTGKLTLLNSEVYTSDYIFAIDGDNYSLTARNNMFSNLNGLAVANDWYSDVYRYWYYGHFKGIKTGNYTVDLRYNYWESETGPATYDTTSNTWVGTGCRVGKEVMYSPYYKDREMKEEQGAKSIGDRDGDGIQDEEDLDPDTPYRTAVILVHGRSDNTAGCFGAENSIRGNSRWSLDNRGEQPKYKSIKEQAINQTTYENGGTELPYNLAGGLKNVGYTSTESLFAFNYGNLDKASESAKNLDGYITNLVEDAKATNNTKQLNSLFRTKQDLANNEYQVDLIGHSFGGIVSRYYIENLHQSEHVRKLVTIDTPHWGSRLANFMVAAQTPVEMAGEFKDTNITGPIDFDLQPDSRMYGGTNESSALFIYGEHSYPLSDELQYKEHGNTRYYAVAGLDYESDDLKMQDSILDIPTNYTSYSQLQRYLDLNILRTQIIGNTDKTIKLEYHPNVEKEGDDVVNLLSQIGWSFLDYNESSSPSKQIKFDGIALNIDSNGGNSLLELLGGHLHSKNQHRDAVISQIIKYLNK